MNFIKSCLFFIFLFTLNIRSFAQKTNKLIDSIPVIYTHDDEKLTIKKTLKISNSFKGDYSNVFNDYQNLTLVEAGVIVKNLPIQIDFGIEKGNLYINDYTKPILNVKFDFDKLIDNLKNSLDNNQSVKTIKNSIDKTRFNETNLNPSIENISNKINEKMLLDSLENQISTMISKEVNSSLKKHQIDSLYNNIKNVEYYEKVISNQAFIEEYVKNKKLLKEYAMGNILPNVNYDSLSKLNHEIENKGREYQNLMSDSTFIQYRKKWNEVLSNNDKMLKINNKITNNYSSSFFDKFKFRNLDFKKFNLGQSSVDRNDLVFKGFMVNGLNIELKSPIYFNFMYSFPFQTNFISNLELTNLQNKKVSTLGGSLGNSLDAKFNYNFGYYSFFEELNAIDSTSKNPMKLKNAIIFSSLRFKASNSISFNIEFANSKSDKYSSSFFNTKYNFMGNSGLKIESEFNLSKTNTILTLGIQEVGTSYYSGANPFIQKGRGGILKLDQKIGNKISFKTINNFRSYKDTNGINSIFSTVNTLNYKLNKNNKFIFRYSYYNTHINFNDLYSKIVNQLFSFTWNTKIKAIGGIHNLNTTLQYIDLNSKSSPELNNTSIQKNIVGLLNYSTTIKKLSLNVNLEFSNSIDSNLKRFNNNLQFNYSFSNSTYLGLGYNIGFINNELQTYNLSAIFNTTIYEKLLVSGSMGYIKNNYLQIKNFNPLLRVSYIIF